MLVRLALTALVLVVAGFALTSCASDADPESFLGYWQETGTGFPHKMHIELAEEPDLYAVTYARSYPEYALFRLEGDELVYSPVSSEMTDVITYDADADSITITSGASGDSRTLTRIESP